MKRALQVLLAILICFAVDFSIDRFMIAGIREYYGLSGHPGLLLVGHSHLMLAADKVQIERELGIPVSKYCREGVNVADRRMMVNHFLNSGCADSLKVVLYGVDLCTFTGEGLSKNSYKLFYPFIENRYVSAYIKSQVSVWDYWLHKTVRTSRYNNDGIKNSAVRGWLRNWDNFKSNTIDIEAYRKQLENGDERHIKMNPDLMEEFTRTIDTLTFRGIRVVLINTPTLDLLNDFEPIKYRQMVDWFQAYADRNELVEYWDFNPEYASRYDLFSDRLHLNHRGQETITRELVARLKMMRLW